MRGSNLHHRLFKAGSKVSHKRPGYTVVGSKMGTRLVLLDSLNFKWILFYAQADLFLFACALIVLITLLYPSESVHHLILIIIILLFLYKTYFHTTFTLSVHTLHLYI